MDENMNGTLIRIAVSLNASFSARIHNMRHSFLCVPSSEFRISRSCVCYLHIH